MATRRPAATSTAATSEVPRQQTGEPGVSAVAPEMVIEADDPRVIAAAGETVWVPSADVLLRVAASSIRSIPVPVAAGAAQGLVVTDDAIFIADFDGGEVIRLDLGTEEVSTVPFPDPVTSFFLEDGLVWAFSGRNGAMIPVDPETMELGVPVNVDGAALSAFGSWWVVDEGRHQVRRFEPGTDRLMATIDLPDEAGDCDLFAVGGVEGLPDSVGTSCYPLPDEPAAPMALIDAATETAVAVDVGGPASATVIDGSWWIPQLSTPDQHGRFVRIDPEALTIDRILEMTADDEPFDPGPTALTRDAVWVPMDPGTERDEVLRFALGPFREP